MNESLVRKRLLALAAMAFFTVLVWLPGFGGAESGPICKEDLLCVVFLDVGQGDAIFIQSPSGVQVLVDAGRDSSVLRELADVMGFWDKDLDYVLATHPDADHVGGLVDVFERYEVANFIRTESESDTSVWQSVERLSEGEGAEIFYARRGQKYDLGGGVMLEILFPDIDPIDLESNTSSIVAKLIYGDTSFMLTGDSPKAIEEYLVLAEGEFLKSNVLKVGHHGSRTSTSDLFLAEVSPDYAVISAGKDNQYGHPHIEVTDMLFNHGVTTYSTAESGRITFMSDATGVVIQ